jgi:hypothetical protein
MPDLGKIERFKVSDLSDLRLQLSNTSFDSWQTADVVSEFLTGRGYGASSERVRHAMLSLNGMSSSEHIQEALERIAFWN